MKEEKKSKENDRNKSVLSQIACDFVILSDDANEILLLRNEMNLEGSFDA